MYLLLMQLFFVSTYGQTWKPQNGSFESNDHVKAFVNANIYLEKNKQLKGATLIIKGNRIIAVGDDIAIPIGALEIDLNGKWVYPSFIELQSDFGVKQEKKASNKKGPQLESNKKGPYYWNESVKAEQEASKLFHFDEKEAQRLRGMGFGICLSQVMDGVIRGKSQLSSLNEKNEKQVISSNAGFHYSFFKGTSKQSYPSSLMGMIALIRQAKYDALYYENQSSEFNASLEAINSSKPLAKFIKVESTLSLFRALKISKEFDEDWVLFGTGKEYQRLKELKSSNVSLIVPINFPKPFDVSDPFLTKDLPLSKLKEWELAPYNLSYLNQFEIPNAISAYKVKNANVFFKNLNLAVKNGFPKEEAIYSLTKMPAIMLGLDSLIGSIETGKLANFLIFDKELFSENAQLLENWVMGDVYRLKPLSALNLEGDYSLNINKKEFYSLKLKSKNGGYQASISFGDQEKDRKVKIKQVDQRIQLQFIDSNQTSRELTGGISDKQSRIWTGKTRKNDQWINWVAVKRAQKMKLTL